MNKGERTKRFIIEQSSSLFNKQGYQTTSITDIMNATKLKKGGIYNHFENKETLARNSFTYICNVLMEIYNETISNKQSASEKYNAVFNVFIALCENEIVEGGCPLMNAAIEADDSKLYFEDKVMDNFNNLINLIKSIIEIGKKQNEIKKDLDPEHMAIFILSSLEGSLALSRLFKDKIYLQLVDKQIKEILFLK
ncbi:TetR/AcrR family transcriptional regulator [Peribacillus simplex]